MTEPSGKPPLTNDQIGVLRYFQQKGRTIRNNKSSALSVLQKHYLIAGDIHFNPDELVMYKDKDAPERIGRPPDYDKRKFQNPYQIENKEKLEAIVDELFDMGLLEHPIGKTGVHLQRHYTISEAGKKALQAPEVQLTQDFYKNFIPQTRPKRVALTEVETALGAVFRDDPRIKEVMALLAQQNATGPKGNEL